jgi:carbamoyltransferase
VINSKILQQSGFKNIWIQPAAGDAGGALGAALAVYHHLGHKRNYNGGDSMRNCLLGPEYTTNQVFESLDKSGLVFKQYDKPELYKAIATEIAAGKVVGYFNGRMEFGPRALGARSILADARDPEMQHVLNQKIKFRESFRPFAPAILEEFAGEYFDLNVKSPYMLMVGTVREEKRIKNQQQDETGIALLKQIRSVIPAVTHVDNTARLQTVNEKEHPDFYQLIKAFYNLTGCPMLINTSFNRMDEPIVCTPDDAIKCFLNTGIDVLVINQFLVRKSAIL